MQFIVARKCLEIQLTQQQTGVESGPSKPLMLAQCQRAEGSEVEKVFSHYPFSSCVGNSTDGEL
jgi:hypothetical protein